MIAELWIDTNGNVYYRMDNWFGFYHVIWNAYSDHNGRDTVKRIPKGAKQLMKDGEPL